MRYVWYLIKGDFHFISFFSNYQNSEKRKKLKFKKGK